MESKHCSSVEKTVPLSLYGMKVSCCPCAFVNQSGTETPTCTAQNIQNYTSNVSNWLKGRFQDHFKRVKWSICVCELHIHKSDFLYKFLGFFVLYKSLSVFSMLDDAQVPGYEVQASYSWAIMNFKGLMLLSFSERTLYYSEASGDSLLSHWAQKPSFQYHKEVLHSVLHKYARAWNRVTWRLMGPDIMQGMMQRVMGADIMYNIAYCMVYAYEAEGYAKSLWCRQRFLWFTTPSVYKGQKNTHFSSKVAYIE